MTPSAPFSAMHRNLLAVLGEDVALVRGEAAPVTFRAFVEQTVQETGQYGRVAGPQRVLQMLRADGTPQRGDVFRVRGVSFPLAEILQDDGPVITVALHG